MRPIRTERCGQFRCQLHALGLQFLERLRHRMAVMEDHEIGNQVIVFDDLQLIVTHVFLDDVRSEIDRPGLAS